MIIQERVFSSARIMSGCHDPLVDLEPEEVDSEVFLDWAIPKVQGADNGATLELARSGEQTLRFANRVGIVMHEVIIAGDEHEQAQLVDRLGALVIEAAE